MIRLFALQFKAFGIKNFIVLKRSWLTNLLRAFILPIAYALFLCYAENFFSRPSRAGLGTAIPIHPLEKAFEPSRLLVWSDGTDGKGFITAKSIMDRVTGNFTSAQKAAVKEAKDVQELNRICLLNFSGTSACSAALNFAAIPSSKDAGSLNYTISYGDTGHIDVVDHTSDVEKDLIPLQWAVDQAIIFLTTGETTPTLFEQPYSYDADVVAARNRHWIYLNLIRSFNGVAFFLIFSGIVYQLAGGLALERASLLTRHMQIMGALDSARILSWHLCTSALYIPGWLITAVIFRSFLFVHTNVGLLIVIHLLTGLALASWVFVLSLPFGKSPHSAAVVSTVLAIVAAMVPIAIRKFTTSMITAFLSFFFPPIFYVSALITIAEFEKNEESPSFTVPDPRFGLQLKTMVYAVLASIFVWPVIAAISDRLLHGRAMFSKKSSQAKEDASPVPPGVALSLRDVRKVFGSSVFQRKSGKFTAIADLTFDVPAYGIFVLLGPNGAGKSTTLSVISGLTQPTSGEVLFEGGISQPPRGALGVVPQKNVLFPELTCLETLRLWSAIKSDVGTPREDLEDLLRDCDLDAKVHSLAGTMSGGQKRKLQLAIGLVGGSKILLVDECTTGVDPLSRRAIWKTLTTYRNERTIIFTTHFLDEADFLGDTVAVLAAPGKLIVSDTPVALKSSMGEGYSVSVRFEDQDNSVLLYRALRKVVPHVVLTLTDEQGHRYNLQTKDRGLVAQALHLIEDVKGDLGIATYDLCGTTIEDIFLELVADPNGEEDTVVESRTRHSELLLSNGVQPSAWKQAATIFTKRALIARRSWLMPLLAMAVAIGGTIWPTRYLSGGVASCSPAFPLPYSDLPLYPPRLFSGQIFGGPLSLDSVINQTLPDFYYWQYQNSYNPKPMVVFVSDRETLIKSIKDGRGNYSISQGGLYMNFDKNEFVVVLTPGVPFLQLFNAATNLFYVRASNSSSTSGVNSRILTTYRPFFQLKAETLFSLQWLAIFGAAMAIFPAFFALYVAKERHSSVLAMQLSNGLSNPLGLWLGHFMFDSIVVTISSVAIAVAYSAIGTKFQGVGFLWLVVWLYGLAATLLAYVVSTVMRSPLGAFGMVIISQFIIYLLYVTGYILILFSPIRLNIPKTMNTMHFALAIVSPIISVTRAGILSVNLFSSICEEDQIAQGIEMLSITRFGGPLLCLIAWCFFLLFVLSQIDTGRQAFWKSLLRKNVPLRDRDVATNSTPPPDVLAEVERALSTAAGNALRVQHVVKSFNGDRVVDDVSFVVPPSSTFVLLGPNGAGKTTTLDIIRGHLDADGGDVIVNHRSVMQDRISARNCYGVCPQFTAIDDHLTVHEHLYIYGRLKGIHPPSQLQRDINALLDVMGMDIYTNRLAGKLSGGNQRKLALAIALIGNPPVILIDEYSTGIDAKMKRELWATLKQVATKKSILLTTHSMEEAAHLATTVGIMAKRMLAVGTPEELEARNTSYEVHFSCRWRLDQLKVETVMERIPGARRMDDVATRFEVPIASNSKNGVASVAQLFDILNNEQDFPEFTIGRSSLETAFIRVINEHKG